MREKLSIAAFKRHKVTKSVASWLKCALMPTLKMAAYTVPSIMMLLGVWPAVDDIKVNAADPAYMTTLSRTVMQQIFNNATWYIEGPDGSYHEIIPSGYMGPYGPNTIDNVSCEGTTSDYWDEYGEIVRSAETVYFDFPGSIHWGVTGSPRILVSINAHFLNVTHIDFICSVYNWDPNTSVTPLELYPYSYAQIGPYNTDFYHQTKNFSESLSNGYYISYADFGTQNNYGYSGRFGCACYNVDYDSPVECYVGDVAIPYAAFNNVNGGRVVVQISHFRLNDGYQYAGGGSPPSPPVTTTTAPAGAGSMQGGIVSDATGYTVAITNEFPGYMYTGSYSDMSDGLGEAVTSIASEAEEAAESAASAVGGLADYDSGIIWYMLERLFLNHPEVIALISGLGAISLFGFVLNRYGR